MKKAILSMLMLLMVALAFADNSVDRVKAIIAVEFQKISLGEHDKFNKTFANVDSVISIINDKKANVKLCEDIKELDFKLSKDTIPDEVIEIIINSNLDNIKAFVNKKKERPEKIKKSLKKKFGEYNENVKISKNKSELSENEIITIDKVSSVKEIKAVETIPWKILFFISFFIFLLLIAGLLFFLYKNKKYIENRFLKIYESHTEEIYKKKNKISELENENRNLRGKIKKLEDEIENFKEAEIFLESEIEKLKNKLSGGSNKVQQEKSKESTIPQNKTTLYLGLAHDGVFVDFYEQYKSGKVLFQLSTYDNETGEFEFVLKPETLSMVNNSITGTIETACVIENDDISIINSIETIKKGKVKKESNEWVIKDKAVVRLS